MTRCHIEKHLGSKACQSMCSILFWSRNILYINVLKIDENRCKQTNQLILVMGATGNREYTVFSTNYWTLRFFMIIMFDSYSLPPSCIIRICHECNVRMDKSVPRVTVWHHSADHEALPSDAKQ